MVGRPQGQKPNLRAGGDGGGSKPWSSSIPDFSTTTWPRSPAGTARGTFGVGQDAGVGTATARGGGKLSCDASSGRGVGVFRGFGVSSSPPADLDFPAFLLLCAVSFVRDFFDFGLGVGVWCRFDFGEAVGSGVSRGFGFGVFSSSLANFAFGVAVAVSRGVADARCFFPDLLVALFVAGLGDFFGFGEEALCVSP